MDAHPADVDSRDGLNSIIDPALLTPSNHSTPSPALTGLGNLNIHSVLRGKSRAEQPASRTEKRHLPQDIKTSAMLREYNDHAVRIVRRDVRDDSDTIGVVRVKRTKDHKPIDVDHAHAPPSPSNSESRLKRSKTFCVRASSGLKFIKNVSLP
ncbi:hypothetical protein AZE42_12493 [Rhizopogon vesiculosus]|uniref:Uncharacterized protein n=1 Tax=Rhizopogon vesiculosus TaxID=180088 RepID=A0A1J8QEK8_9AGAM|nr:hypothetical protein AZE42_12493 [Rhizopogon vesiculosus]